MSYDPYAPEEPRRPIAVGPLVWGIILIVVGVGWLLSTLEVATIPWRAALAIVLVIVGIAMSAAAASGASTEGLFGAGVTLAIILALLSTFASTFTLPLAGGIGERSLSPTIATLESEYNLLAGQMVINLEQVQFPEGETRIEVGVTFGQVDIVNIPDDVAVSVSAHVTAGEAHLLGSRWDGVSIDQTKTDAGFAEAPRKLVIDVQVGFGQLGVRR